ncbi:hypothetical protein OS21_40820 [Dickeya oryzae]
MSRCVIQVINPNTSLAMTETIGEAARRVASAGTEILAVCPSQGVPSIEGHFDEAVATLGVLEQVRLGREQGVSGHVIACFGDPGLLAARELASAPVVGIAEAAMHLATLVATRFFHCHHAAAHAHHRPSSVAALRFRAPLRRAACDRFAGAGTGGRARSGTT